MKYGNVLKILRKKINENRQTLLALNMTLEDVYSLLRSLGINDYSKGPEDDLDGSAGEVIVFNKLYNEKKLYIKVKLFKVQNEECLKIISFHT